MCGSEAGPHADLPALPACGKAFLTSLLQACMWRGPDAQLGATFRQESAKIDTSPRSGR